MYLVDGLNFIAPCQLAEALEMGNIFPPMEQLNPNDLLIYARVAEAGSFSKAAERLGLPKSTVSRRIALLEEQLGERLMERSTRQSKFTEFGLQLLEHARHVAEEVEAVADLSESRHAQPSGRLRVSMPGEMGVLLLDQMLADYNRRYPAVQLEIDLSPRRVDLLAEGFDLAVRVGKLPEDSTLTARKIATLSNSLYASAEYLKEYGTPTSPEDLKDHKGLMIFRSNNTQVPWNLSRGDVHWEGAPQSVFSANSPGLLIRLASQGRGITAVSDRFVALRIGSGELQRVLPEWSLPPNIAWAVYPGRRLLQPKTRAFMDMMHKALNSDSVAEPTWK